MLLCASVTACSSAGTVHLSIEDALNSELAQEKLDPSIRMSFGKGPAQGREIGTWVSNKKTNNVGKSIEKSCQRAFISALISLQDRARVEGGSQITNIHSYYKKVPFWSDTEFYCEEGHIMSGVALRGTVVK